MNTFYGALLPICGVEALIVSVPPCVLADPHEANLFTIAFQMRFGRPVVLMACDKRGLPHYFGPTEIARRLAGLPFELIPWNRYLYRAQPLPSWQLPIPQDTVDEAGQRRAVRSLGDRSGVRQTAALKDVREPEATVPGKGARRAAS